MIGRDIRREYQLVGFNSAIGLSLSELLTTTSAAPRPALARNYGPEAGLRSIGPASMFNCRFGLRIERPDSDPRPCAELLTLGIRSDDLPCREARPERVAVRSAPVMMIRMETPRERNYQDGWRDGSALSDFVRGEPRA